jgi:predicted nucleic acid-binding Zn ribbon protein
MKPFLRRRVLEEWRGLPQPGPEADRTVSVGAVLASLAPKLGLSQRLQEEEVVAAWGDIVGEFFARHSRPTRLQQGTLFVQVLQPTILYELDRHWKPMILAKLRERFGGKCIQAIRFKVGG